LKTTVILRLVLAVSIAGNEDVLEVGGDEHTLAIGGQGCHIHSVDRRWEARYFLGMGGTFVFLYTFLFVPGSSGCSCMMFVEKFTWIEWLFLYFLPKQMDLMHVSHDYSRIFL
jgi:hypothetical protein